LHVNAPTHLFELSPHALPTGSAGFEQTPVLVLHVPAAWQESLAAHTTAVPLHAPPVHTSFSVQALPSEHDVPSAFAGFEQTPVDVSHVPTAWHWSLTVHTTGFDPVHVPDWHVSVCVHAFPSLHAVPSTSAGFEQSPELVSHAPAEWHWSLAAQTTGSEPVHTPAWHAYAWKHLFVPAQS